MQRQHRFRQIYRRRQFHDLWLLRQRFPVQVEKFDSGQHGYVLIVGWLHLIQHLLQWKAVGLYQTPYWQTQWQNQEEYQNWGGKEEDKAGDVDQLNKDKKVIKKDEMDSRAPNIKPITTYFKETFKESLARKGYRRQLGWTLLGMVSFYDFLKFLL